mgnify:FL=1
MQRNLTLVITSVLSLLLLTVHLTDDTVRGISPTGPESMYAIVVAGLLLCATLAHPHRPIGIVAMMFIGLFSVAMAPLHLRGTRINELAAGQGGFLFIWTLWALGILGVVVLILGARELWFRIRSPKAG